MYGARFPYRRDHSDPYRKQEMEKQRMLQVINKLRSFRPYLKKRLEVIKSTGKEKELKDEVEDIHFYLEVMSDILAYENHGLETLNNFIDRIHEMIRKNPTELSQNNYGLEEDDNPRSPSPTESSFEQQNPTVIPTEREHGFNNPNFAANQRYNPPTRFPSRPYQEEWGNSEFGVSGWAHRRDDFRPRDRDIDMRSSGAGPGHSGERSRRMSDERRYDRFSQGPPHRNRDWDHSQYPYNHDRNDSHHRKYGRSEDRTWEKPRDDDWEAEVERRDRDRRRERDLTYENDYRSSSHDRSSSFSPREYERDSRFSRSHSRPRDYDYDHGRRMSSPIDLENAFERRPAFERRESREPSVPSISDPEIHDYNHELPVPILAAQDQDMRTQSGLVSPSPSFLPIDPSSAKQPPLLGNMNPGYVPNSAYGKNVNQFPSAAVGVAGQPPNGPPGMRPLNSMPPPNFPQVNPIRGGLLPTPPYSNYGNIPPHPHAMDNSYARQHEDERMKEMFMQKAQECFSRNNPRFRPPGPGPSGANQHGNQSTGPRGPNPPYDPRWQRRRDSGGEEGGASSSNKNGDPSHRDHGDSVKSREEALRARVEGIKGMRIKPREPIKKVDKITKIQDFRKQMEKEQPIRLGRGGIHSKRGQSEEPPEVPEQVPSTSKDEERTSPEKEKSRSPSRESRTSPSRRSRGGKSKSPKRKDEHKESKKKRKEKEVRSADKESSKDKDRKKRKSDKVQESNKKRSSTRKSTDNLNETVDNNVPTTSKKSGFRIPKIKRPPTPVASPQPEEHSEDTEEDTEKTDKPKDGEAEEFIKKIIQKSYPADDAANLLKNPSAITQLLAIFKEQVKKLPLGTSGEEEAKETDSKENTEGTDDVADDSNKPGPSQPSDRSRSKTKRKNTKRRSSLEKLHDALQEMKFDAMLPLGPRNRKSTRTGAVADDSSQHSSENSVANIFGASAETSANSSFVEGESGSQENLNSTISSIDLSEEPSTQDTDKSSPPVPKKRGRKRKRKQVPVAPKKRGKKAGPITRAQVAVSKAIENTNKKDQEKKSNAENEASASTSTPSSRFPKRKLKEILKRNRIASDVRVTRSASKFRAHGIAVNQGLTKIKLECDYIPPPKTEPVDYDAFVEQENGNMLTMEDLQDLPEPSPAIINVRSLNMDGNLPVLSVDDLSQEIQSLENKDPALNTDDVSMLPPEFQLDMKSTPSEMMDTSFEILEELTGNSMSGNVEESTAMLPTANEVPPTEVPSTSDAGGPVSPSSEQFYPSTDSSAMENRRRAASKKPRQDLYDCTLCSFSGKKIVWHYVNNHPDATIPEACLDDGTYNGLISANISKSPQLLEIHLGDDGAADGRLWPCLYCNDRFAVAREYYEHLTSHTGEYIYGCAICHVKQPYSRTITNHLKTHKLRDMGVEARSLVQAYEPSITGREVEIYGYLCNDCHYFQLMLSNLSRHLQEKNHSESDAMCIKLNIPRPRSPTPPEGVNNIDIGDDDADDVQILDELQMQLNEKEGNVDADMEKQPDPVVEDESISPPSSTSEAVKPVDFDASVFLGSTPNSEVDSGVSTSLPDVITATSAIPASHLKEKQFNSLLLKGLLSKLEERYESEESNRFKCHETDTEVIDGCRATLDWMVSSLVSKEMAGLKERFEFEVKNVLPPSKVEVPPCKIDEEDDFDEEQESESEDDGEEEEEEEPEEKERKVIEEEKEKTKEEEENENNVDVEMGKWTKLDICPPSDDDEETPPLTPIVEQKDPFIDADDEPQVVAWTTNAKNGCSSNVLNKINPVASTITILKTTCVTMSSMSSTQSKCKPEMKSIACYGRGVMSDVVTSPTKGESPGKFSVPSSQDSLKSGGASEKSENCSQVSVSESDVAAAADPDTLSGLSGHELYKCGNPNCNFSAPTPNGFKEHGYVCTFGPDTKECICKHCDKRVKSVPSLMEHIKVHGLAKLSCGLCAFRCCFTSELAKHVKGVHRVHNYKNVKGHVGADEEPFVKVVPRELMAKLSMPDFLEQNHIFYSPRVEYGPDDVDSIPTASIFSSIVFCKLCSYGSKVRSNIVRHLKLHATTESSIVPCSTPVNPVPCLERNELMFDKMTNWAGSSHSPKSGGITAEESKKLPQFVPEQFRFVCSVQSCKQITVDDSMLRAHMRALHSEVSMYACPHCQDNEFSRGDPRNTVTIEKLGNHLKLHGPRLFRCGHCDIIHTNARIMEKHVSEKHPEKKPIHYLIRNFDPEATGNNRRNSTDDNQKPPEKWRCALCVGKTFFFTWKEAKLHCENSHKVPHQFMCSSCRFSTDVLPDMLEHTRKLCPDIDKEKLSILVMFFRNEATEMLESNLPVWRRNTTTVKHIRGIFLEETKRFKEKPETSTSVSSSHSKNTNSTAAGSTSTSVTASTSKSGKNSISNSTPTKVPTSPSKQTSSIVEDFVLVCPRCSVYKTKNAPNLVIHLYNELRYKRYVCALCDFKFVTENSLRGHVDTDHGVPYEKSVFQVLPVNEEIEEYVRKSINEQYVRVKYEEDGKVSEVKVICKHCNALFYSFHNFRTHILAKHVAKDRYKCGHCSCVSWSEGTLFKHHGKYHVDLPFVPMVNPEIEDKLTPDFWSREYGIPTGKAFAKAMAAKLANSGSQAIAPAKMPTATAANTSLEPMTPPPSSPYVQSSSAEPQHVFCYPPLHKSS